MPPYVWFAFISATGLAVSGLVAKIMVRYRICNADLVTWSTGLGASIAAVCGLYIAFEAADGVTVPNVILGSRGLFVLAAGYLLRGVLKVPMERQPPSVYGLRAAGTILFLATILLVSSAG